MRLGQDPISPRLFIDRSKTLALSFILLTLAIGGQSFATATQVTAKTAFEVCKATDLDFDDSADVNAMTELKVAVVGLLKKEKFDELDCLADGLRSGREKYASGMWKLHTIYSGLDQPLRHATEKDWKDNLNHLQHWNDVKPKSVTARIALAKAYIGYGWDARGEGLADTVSESGWRLLGERAKKAKQILDKAWRSPVRCPEWYLTMQQVALAQGWGVEEARALFERAIAFEPTYYEYYAMQAHFLLPQWHGEDGDSEKFAQEIADRIGGPEGDVVYFQTAMCGCDVPDLFKRMSWPRLKKGYAELERRYGPSLINQNLVAFMAVRFGDGEFANSMFQHIGENWDKAIWKKQETFAGNKSWASGVTSMMASKRLGDDNRKAAESNMKTTGGELYRRQMVEALTPVLQYCAKAVPILVQRAELLFQVGEHGEIVQPATLLNTPAGACLYLQLKKQGDGGNVLPAPPHPAYWVRMDMDFSKYLPPAN